MDETTNLNRALRCAVQAARTAGALMRRHLHASKRANLVTQHDIKLELDVTSQKLIERILRRALPAVPVLGEEGETGDLGAPYRWVVDPIDGTVNFSYGIPHAAVSIALQQRAPAGGTADYGDGYNTVAGVVYDPFQEEMWTALRGGKALVNGKPVRVSRRARLNEGIVSIGFAKSRETLDATLPYFNQLIYRIRKVRLMGSAALALAYVASGRFDAYIEGGISLWDIAAGGLILECAGGEFWHRPIAGHYRLRMIADNGRLRKSLRVPWG